MTDSELIEIIEHVEKILPQFKGNDHLKRIISIQRERLKDAAALLGGEWVGIFSDAHVEIMARAYQEALRRTVVRASHSAQGGSE